MKCQHGIKEGKLCAFCKSDEKEQSDFFANRDMQGRLHGVQPQIGSGEVVYEHGTLKYLDDGNGNVFDADAEDYDEQWK